MKPPVFIGSSSESSEYAELIRQALDKELDITLWTDKRFFKPGSGTYETLYRKSICFKYAVFVAGKDDIVFRPLKRKLNFKARDNVYYEMGLYSGILSPGRTFFLVHKDVKIASDFLGVTCLKFSNTRELKEKCQDLLKRIKEKEEESAVTFLPTVPLAEAYYNNYIRPVCMDLLENHRVKIEDKEYQVDQTNLELKIVFPEKVSDDWHEYANLYYRQNNYSIAEIKAGYREFDVYVKKEEVTKNGIFRGCMSVDTMKIVYQVIHRVLSGGSFTDFEQDEMIARKKEACVFYDTLKKLIETGTCTRNIVKVIQPDWAKD